MNLVRKKQSRGYDENEDDDMIPMQDQQQGKEYISPRYTR